MFRTSSIDASPADHISGTPSVTNIIKCAVTLPWWPQIAFNLKKCAHGEDNKKYAINGRTCHDIIIISLSPYRVFICMQCQSHHSQACETCHSSVPFNLPDSDATTTHNESSIVLTSDRINGVSKILYQCTPEDTKKTTTRSVFTGLAFPTSHSFIK